MPASFIEPVLSSTRATSSDRPPDIACDVPPTTSGAGCIRRPRVISTWAVALTVTCVPARAGVKPVTVTPVWGGKLASKKARARAWNAASDARVGASRITASTAASVAVWSFARTAAARA